MFKAHVLNYDNFDIALIRDVDSDPVGFAFIMVRGSGSRGIK